MARIALVLSSLALAACASERSASPPAPAPNAAAPSSVHLKDVDDLLRELSEQDRNPAAATQTASQGQPQRPVIYAIPRVSRPIPADEPTASAAYEENLTTCLDGRFSAFCDHAELTSYDKDRVHEAEYRANLTTCADPQWQDLCRRDLLPLGWSPPTARLGSYYRSSRR